MQLKKWLALAVVAVILDLVTPIILLTSTAAATTTALTITVGNTALAAVGGAAILLGAAKLVALAASSKRRRRAVAGAPEDAFAADAIDVLFAAAGSLDRETNCGLRLVCELAATPAEQLAEDEILIMSLFGSQNGLQHDQVNSPVTPFQLSSFLGSQSKSVQACATTYPRCELSASQIMDNLRQNRS